MWGTDVNGGNMDAKAPRLTGTDCWGKVAVLNFDGKYDKFGFLVTTSDWNKYGADRSATVSADAPPRCGSTAPSTRTRRCAHCRDA